MKRKGFTLIELLAVIVVLAVIALIATPIVTKTIENSKRGAAIESVHNMIETAELYFITANPKYGKISLLDENLKYSGQKPELGEIELDKDGNSRIYAYVSGYCVTKEFNTELYASKMNKEECNWYATDNYETTEGTTFTLNNQTIKNYLIYGNSTQATRSGKNLFDYSYLNSTYSSSGLTMTSTDDVITINGTLNNQGNLTLSKDFPNKFDTSKTYTLKIHVIGGDGVIGDGTGITFSFALFNSTNTKYVRTNVNATALDNIASVTFSGSAFEGDENLHFLLQNWRLESTYNNYQVKIQIEEGSTATSYEKYGVMPSPEFPSEIKSTGDLLTNSNCASYGSDACNNIGKYVVQVKNSSKNILNINTSDVTLNYADVTKIENGLDIKSTGATAPTRAIIKFDCKPNTNYVVSGKLQIVKDTTTGGNNSILINTKTLSGVTIKGKAYEKTNSSEQDIHIEFNSGEYKTLYLWLYLNTAGTSGTEVENKYTNLMIEEGTTSSNYESYVEPKTTNIYLTEPLRKVGDYADYIDFANKKVVRIISSKTFNGTERWTIMTDVGVARAMQHTLTDSKANTTYSLLAQSNYYVGSSWQDVYSGKIGVARGKDAIRIRPAETLPTVDEWKALLQQQYNARNPLVVNYVLAEQTEETIDLPNIELLNGSSTLSINTEVSPSNVKLTTSK